jgi:hypothetical protein
MIVHLCNCIGVSLSTTSIRNIVLVLGARLEHFDCQPSSFVDAFAIFKLYKLALQLVVVGWDLVPWVCTWTINTRPIEYQIRCALLALWFHILDFFFCVPCS